MKKLPVMAHGPLIALTLMACAIAQPAAAKTDLTTLPSRERSEVTIYNSQDLTFARESRTLSFRKGLNQIQFSWANTQIDPTSLQIDLKNAAGLSLLDAVYPKDTNEVVQWNIEAEAECSKAIEIKYFVRGLSWSANYAIVANADETAFSSQQFTRITNNSGEDYEGTHVRVVIGDVNLEERIDAVIAKWNNRFGRRDRAILGRASGGAKNVSEMDELKKKEDAPAGSLRFQSQDFLFADDKISQAKQIFKKAVSEYRLFSVEGEEDLQTGWSKSLPNPRQENIPFDMSYELDARRYGPRVVKFYKLVNDAKHSLGKEAFPEGAYYVYRTDPRGGLAFEGYTTHKYIPESEKIELNLGSDGLITINDHELTRARGAFAYNTDGNIGGWDETIMRQIDVKNSRERAIPFRLTLRPSDPAIPSTADDSIQYSAPVDATHADVISSEPKHEQVDRDTMRWELSIPAQTTTPIKFTYVLHFGTNVKAN